MDSEEFSPTASQRRAMEKKKKREQAAKGPPATQAPTTHPEPPTETSEDDAKLKDERSGVDESSPQREEGSTLADDPMAAAGVMSSLSLSDGITPAAVMRSSARVESSSLGGEESSTPLRSSLSSVSSSEISVDCPGCVVGASVSNQDMLHPTST